MAATKIALNGNIKSASDPDFIHFKGEQSGILLPSCPGYPSWLPQLQLTPDGRLCFWNFPNTIYQSVVSNSLYKMTPEYLRDGKTANTNNLYPPIPAPFLGTNGVSNQYFWNACNTYFLVTPDLRNFFVTLEAQRIYVLNKTSAGGNKNITMESATADVYFPAVGGYATVYPWDWIFKNVQWYLNKYLNIPYDVSIDPPQGKGWKRQLSEASQKNDLLGWLGVTNFLVAPVSDPSFWDKVLNAVPIGILAVVGGVLSFASLGAATPALVAAVGAITTAGKTAQTKDAQAVGQAAYDQATAGVNLTQIKNDIAENTVSALSNLSDAQKKYIFIGLVALFIIIVLIIKTKSK